MWLEISQRCQLSSHYDFETKEKSLSMFEMNILQMYCLRWCLFVTDANPFFQNYYNLTSDITLQSDYFTLYFVTCPSYGNMFEINIVDLI